TALDIVAPPGLDVPRLAVVGVGKARDLKAQDFVKLGGFAMGRVPSAASEATMIADLPGGAVKPERVADLALGAELRAYRFCRYKTKHKEGEEKAARVRLAIAVAGASTAQNASPPPRPAPHGIILAP